MVVANPIDRQRNRISSQRTHILIVDDHPFIRRGMIGVIDEEADLEVCGEASNAREALSKLKRLPAEVLVVDISLTDGCGLELVRRIKEAHPRIRVLVCTMHDESVFALRSLRSGADGFVCKDEAPETIVKAIRKIMRGEFYFSPWVTAQVLRGASTPDGKPESMEPADCLSDRELEIFTLIGTGRTTQQIAAGLSIAVKTVESHRHNIKRKLDLLDGVQLTHAAIRWVLENGKSLRT